MLDGRPAAVQRSGLTKVDKERPLGRSPKVRHSGSLNPERIQRSKRQTVWLMSAKPMNPEQSQPPKVEVSTDAVYTAFSNDRVMMDQLLWQVPVISLAAQAFLLTIAYYSSTSVRYQRPAGIIAFTIGFASWLLFLRHAALEKEASCKLERLEEEHCWREFHGKLGKIPDASFFGNFRPRPVWKRCLFLISSCGLVPVFPPVVIRATGDTAHMSRRGSRPLVKIR